MIKFIHTGDVHIGVGSKHKNLYNRNKRRIEIMETFFKIIDRCQNTDILLIAGDLFDDTYCTLSDIRMVVDKLKDIENTKVFIATGNHDPLVNNSLYDIVDWPPNVHIFSSTGITKVDLEDKNLTVWGYSWSSGEEYRNLIEDMEIGKTNDINILLIHGDIFDKNSKYMPLDKRGLKEKGFDYVALGHIHKHQFIEDNIAYCGSPEPLDFGELGEHGIIEGTLGNKYSDFKFVPLSNRKYIIDEIKINGDISYTDIIDKILSCYEEESRMKNYFRIKLVGTRDRDLDLNGYDLNHILSEKFYYIEINDETFPDYDLDEMKKEYSGSIIDKYIRIMEKKGLENPVVKDALYIGLEELLREKVILK
ncbi:metallophosphoesterase family protein [Clostridiisalibacter paucivorans]|uniref:metallophosphoesterase family protein n=1 Tax=Clostridiisalibacter paucivorans TaxID=408753 RepID=UPI00047BC7AB|nr:DNA repair exonuclease [Clostridiisalibacter paucivorans]